MHNDLSDPSSSWEGAHKWANSPDSFLLAWKRTEATHGRVWSWTGDGSVDMYSDYSDENTCMRLLVMHANMCAYTCISIVYVQFVKCRTESAFIRQGNTLLHLNEAQCWLSRRWLSQGWCHALRNQDFVQMSRKRNLDVVEKNGWPPSPSDSIVMDFFVLGI